MTIQAPPTALGQLPQAAPGESYFLHVADDGTEYKLARNWPKHSIFVRVEANGQETTCTYARREGAEILVPIPRGAGWLEVETCAEPKRDGTMVLWVRRRA